MFKFLAKLLEPFRKQRFARRMQDAFAAAGNAHNFVYDQAEFCLRHGETVVFLHNVYRAYQLAARQDRAEVIARFARGLATGASATDIDQFSLIEDKLTAVVRERAFLAFSDGPGWGLQVGSKPLSKIAREEISSWYGRALVIDYDDQMAVVMESHLKAWNLTFDEAFQLGLQRLRAYSVPQFEPCEGGFHRSTWNDDYDSSRILLPGIFDDLPLQGDPVVVLVNRCTLLVADAEDPGAIMAMLAYAEQVLPTLAKPQNLSPLLVRGGAISEYHAPAGTPLFSRVQRAHKLAALSTYEEQRSNLEATYAKLKKDDVYVAAFRLFETPSGIYESVSTLTKTVPTLLPVTDRVTFMDLDRPEADQHVGTFPWARVEQVLGGSFLDTKMFPLRYYISRFPTTEELQRLSA